MPGGAQNAAPGGERSGTAARAGITAQDNTGRQHGTTAAEGPATDRGVRSFLRANPQAVVLLVICLVLGLGTFIAVLIALATAGSGTTTGEPSGLIVALHLLAR